MSSLFHKTLKKYWGYESFRPVQLAAIESIYNGKDTFVLMPTGGGKSLLYQLPAVIMEGVCVVITPLISLMKDQVDRLKQRGISAIAIHSGMTAKQIDIALDNCVYGDVKFLYVSPERLESEIFRMRVMRMKVSIIAVDEAHCISQWGYDFRPPYLRIAALRKIVPDAPILALTASATKDVIEDITLKLEFRDDIILRSSFSRPNLIYVVREAEDKREQLLRVINNVKGSGIVYVRTRENTQQIANILLDEGITAEYYHGGLSYEERSLRQDMWKSGRCRVIVATNAFGMGIDKSDVRFVVHYDICDSVEAYYQESGRAGRDGKRSYAVLLSAVDDLERTQRRFAMEYPSIQMIKECYQAIFNYLQVGIGEGKYASFEFNLFEFTSRHKFFAPTALSAISILQHNGYMQLTDPATHPPRIMFIVSRDDLYKIRIEKQELDHFIRVILRLYDGLFHGFVPVDESEIASVSGYTLERVKELFKLLWDIRVIRYRPGTNSPLLILLEERLPIEDVRISPESYATRKRIAAQRVENMFSYSANRDKCRSVVLQSYFGEENPKECNVCDICLSKRSKNDGHELTHRILTILDGEGMDIKKLVACLSCDVSHVVKQIDILIGEGKISIDVDGKMVVNR